MRAPSTLRRRRRAGLPAFVALVLLAGAAAGAGRESPGGAGLDEAAARELARMRPLLQCGGSPTDDVARTLAHRGRPAIEITGRERDAAAGGRIRDSAVLDLAIGRIVTYTCPANASKRQANEPIISLAEISSLADVRVHAILPGVSLALESIQRYRMSREEGIYYELRYAPSRVETPFFESPVRLLVDAATGGLFRLDIDPDWLDPAAPPRLEISRKAAERIAAVVLRGSDLAPTFGAGAVFAKAGAAELFMVRANAVLGFRAADPGARAQPAWVVPFQLRGGSVAGSQSVFVDAATGKIIGGAVLAAPEGAQR